MQASPVISCVSLTKVFRDFWHRARVKAVHELDLNVQPGEIYGLLGPNGSGKSTTIKMILGLLHPTRGRVSVFDKPPDDVRTKNRIGYLPEESYLYRFLNARETLNYYATLFQLERRDRNRRVEELLEMVGLKSAARRPVGEYSKGMARRIGLAQALINDPDLLILDEPTSGLDPIGSKLVKDIIVRLGREYKKTILLSSHLLADCEEVCDRVTILFGGKIQVSGGIEEVLARQDQMQMTCARLSDETMAEVRRVIEIREHKPVTFSTPKDRLESLFLRIVEQAHQQRVETAGAASAGAIAGFLGEDSGRDVIDALVKAEDAVEKLEPVAAAPRVDDNLLGKLTAPSVGTPVEPQAAPTPVDRNVLDDLIGDESKGGR